MDAITSKKRVVLPLLCLLLALALCLAGCKEQPVPEPEGVVLPGGPASIAQPESQPGPTSQADPFSYRLPMRRDDIDFAALQGANPDIIGWIEVPGDVIDYPVLCTDDNAFYLNHDEYRNQSTYGAIFIDMANGIDFTSPVTVAYGHYTPDRTYFTSLHNYKDSSYFRENREIYVYTPYGQLDYLVVAAFEIDNRNILYGKDYHDPAAMQEFVDWLKSQRSIDANVEEADLDAESRYLVLSTCVQEVGGDNRYIVVAKMLEAA